MAEEQTKEAKATTEMKTENLADAKDETATGTRTEELFNKNAAAEKPPEELGASDKKDEKKDTKPAELVDKKEDEKGEKKSKEEIYAEELAQRKKAAAGAQCDDFSKWVKEKCPNCPPIPRMFLYSIPVFFALPLLYRKFFCPPKCLRIGKCSKIYPGCCEPENLCNKPPCCNRR